MPIEYCVLFAFSNLICPRRNIWKIAITHFPQVLEDIYQVPEDLTHAD